LRGERLGRRHADLGPGAGEQRGGCQPGRLRAAHVADREQETAPLARQSHRRQGVRGLTRLRDPDHQGIRPDQRLAVPELRRVVDVARHPGQPLDVELADLGGVPRGTAGDHLHPLQLLKQPLLEADVAERRRRCPGAAAPRASLPPRLLWISLSMVPEARST
jgi:hypothetical protein